MTPASRGDTSARPDRPVRAGVVAAAPTASRYAPFDGLRAVAVLLVFGSHVAVNTVPGAWVGVDLFFALSGFLITTLLLEEHVRSGRIDLRAFYVRRALRLVPALVVAVAVLVPIAVAVGVPGALAGGIAAVTYTMDIYAPLVGSGSGQIFGHTWSLAVEEQFYLVWPFLLIVGLRSGLRRVGRIAVALSVAGAAVGALVAVVGGGDAAYTSPFPHLPVLLGGALLALVARTRAHWLQRLRTPWVVVAALTVVVVVALFVRTRQLWLYFGGKALIGAVLVLLVGHIYVLPSGWAARAMGLRPLAWLGERSYGFYLWHLPIVWLVHVEIRLGRNPAAVLALLLTLGVTVLSWRLVERPFLRLKRRFGRAVVPV